MEAAYGSNDDELKVGECVGQALTFHPSKLFYLPILLSFGIIFLTLFSHSHIMTCIYHTYTLTQLLISISSCSNSFIIQLHITLSFLSFPYSH